MLRRNISEGIKTGMKKKDSSRLDALRYLWSLIKNKEIDVKKELGDDEIMVIVRSEVKKRKEAIEQMKRSGRDKLIEEEEAKLEVLKEFIPEEMSEVEIEKIVDEVIGEGGEGDFGKIMGMVMAKTKGKADGKLVAGMVKMKLGS